VTRPHIPETELASHIVRWLRAEQYEVYQEVGTGRTMPVADIVAVNGYLHWIVACKTNLGLAVLGQALHWVHRYGHFVSIATIGPVAARSGRCDWPGEAASTILHDYGIGLLQLVWDAYNEAWSVKEKRPPALHRHNLSIGKYLVEAQKTWAPAGNANGDRWTPFQQTCENLRRYVASHCGCTLKDAIEGVDHHYRTDSSARANLNQWLSRGVVKGVVRDGATRPYTLHVEPCRCPGRVAPLFKEAGDE